jgi:3-oxoacyl-[acyl-carrier protein] reductase
MEKLLKGRVLLVTGGDRGIGKAIVEKCVSEDGFIALHYNKGYDQAKAVKSKFNNSISLFNADLSDPLNAVTLFDNVVNSTSKIDVLINNAGVAIDSDLSGNDTDWLNAWNTTISINLTSAAILCRKAILHFISNGIRGRIINISSRAAFRGDTADYLAYAASKGGMVALTRSLARAYGKNGIVAFTVAPGFVKTDMAESFFTKYGKDNMLKDNALAQITLPDDIAPLVSFLASGQADHSTGGTFDINAGSYVH